jgi:hypothetical protein
MIETLLQPADCLFLFVDYQAGLAFGVESIARQAILKTLFPWLAPPWSSTLRLWRRPPHPRFIVARYCPRYRR